MKNKIPFTVVIADTHLSKNNIKLVKDIFQQTIDLCKKQRIQTIFHLGDFFHSREAQPLQVLLEAKEIFMMLKNSNIEFYIIPGNHDKVFLESENSYLDVFNNDCILLSKETYQDFDGLRIHFLPYFKENGSYLERLNNLSQSVDKEKINILLTHIAINNVQNNDGSPVECEVKQELFKVYDKVFVGHYHNAQSQGNIFYIGSSHQSNFGEDNLKGFTILFSDCSHKFIKSKFPEYIKIDVEFDELENGTLDQILDEYSNSEDNIRVVISGDKESLRCFDKTRLTKFGIDVKFKSKDIIKSKEKSNELIVYNRSNIKSAFTDFCKKNKIKDNKFGNKYLEQILN